MHAFAANRNKNKWRNCIFLSKGDTLSKKKRTKKTLSIQRVYRKQLAFDSKVFSTGKFIWNSNNIAAIYTVQTEENNINQRKKKWTKKREKENPKLCVYKRQKKKTKIKIIINWHPISMACETKPQTVFNPRFNRNFHSNFSLSYYFTIFQYFYGVLKMQLQNTFSPSLRPFPSNIYESTFKHCSKLALAKLRCGHLFHLPFFRTCLTTEKVMLFVKTKTIYAMCVCVCERAGVYEFVHHSEICLVFPIPLWSRFEISRSFFKN